VTIGARIRAGTRQGLQRAVATGRHLTAPKPHEPAPRPPVPTGWRVGPPDFVGVGATGAATAWWHAAIERHPEVARAPGAAASLHWFDRFWTEEPPPDMGGEYAAWFPRPDGSIAGEWTPTYLADVWVPPLLARAAPDARILVLLADPLPRFLAAYARAVAAQPRTWDERDVIGQFMRGLHAEQLRALFRAVPREHVLVLQEEVCRDDPAGQLARTFAHLGLATDATLTTSMVQPPQPPRDPGAEVPESIRRAISVSYTVEVDQLAELAPELDFDRWTIPPTGHGG
jgi:hypothetical protein